MSCEEKDALFLCFTKIIKLEKCILNFIQCFMAVIVKSFDFLLVKITLLYYFSWLFAYPCLHFQINLFTIILSIFCKIKFGNCFLVPIHLYSIIYFSIISQGFRMQDNSISVENKSNLYFVLSVLTYYVDL